MNCIRVIVFCLSALVFASCGKKKTSTAVKVEESIISKPSLELLWQTDSLLTTAESVLYDASSGVIFVANINNAPWEKDNNGFISTINSEGEIMKLKWMEGFSAPKGMGIYKGKLYVNDIDRLVEIDIAHKAVSNVYHVEGGPNLNDITVSEDGIVYSSGSKTNTIYKLEDQTIEVYAKKESGRLNGLLSSGNQLYYLDFQKGELGAYSHQEKSFKALTSGLTKGDGVIQLENGDFIASGWAGEIFYIHSKDWSKTKLLDTSAESINSADIEYISETSTLLVPTFFDNRVVAYKLVYN